MLHVTVQHGGSGTRLLLLSPNVGWLRCAPVGDTNLRSWLRLPDHEVRMLPSGAQEPGWVWVPGRPTPTSDPAGKGWGGGGRELGTKWPTGNSPGAEGLGEVPGHTCRRESGPAVLGVPGVGEGGARTLRPEPRVSRHWSDSVGRGSRG